MVVHTYKYRNLSLRNKDHTFETGYIVSLKAAQTIHNRPFETNCYVYIIYTYDLYMHIHMYKVTISE